MTDYFDLEQEIMKCWEITSDLHVVAKHINDGSDYTDLIVGMAQMYDMKFQKMWDTFEKMIEANKNSDYVFVCKHCGDELGIKWSEDTIGEVRLNSRKPLSEDDLKEVLKSVSWTFPESIKSTDSEYSLQGVLEAYKKIVKVVRAIEAKHGIGENDE